MTRTGGYPVLLGGIPVDQELAETTIAVIEVAVNFMTPVGPNARASLSRY